MRLRAADGSSLRLAYGMNVHPGGSVDALEAALASTVAPLRDRLGVEGRFGIALRLDAEAVLELRTDDERRRLLRDLLAGQELVPFTGNAFVAGDFHDARGVKEAVYRPTWDEVARERYTIAFAEVLAGLAAPGDRVSLSTAPGSFRPFGEPAGFDARAAARLVSGARRLEELAQESGVVVVLGLEPEPLCTLETTADALAFFEGPLARAAAAAGATAAARAHLGLCYDVCHQAVEFEDPVASLAALARAGITVVKLQASSALELPDASDPAGRAALAGFDEPRWLHQTVVRARDGALVRCTDLAEALRGPRAAEHARPGSVWRTHFHVPVHRPEAIPPLRTTRSDLARALAVVAQGGTTPHVEVETYTWDALPAGLRAGSLVESLARELEWTRDTLVAAGATPDPEDPV
jgi:hypothetical protein